jgi:predicted AAA+ superfamily ATPase
MTPALTDPVGFVDSPELLVIDEIQRAPELLLAIKASVDEDPRPGRYLLTGSSRLFGMVAAPDALPGRMETVELWPFSQGEIDGAPDGFIDAIFALGPDLRHESAVTRADYAARIARGGLPEAAARTDARRRERFFDAYVQSLIDRDVRQLADIQRKGRLRTLIRLLATRAGTIIAAGALESTLGLSRPTVARYLQVLEEIFLVKRIPGWSRNLGTRATAAPKLIVGIEVKAAPTVGSDDFRGLRRLADRLGDDFVAGIVLYTGTATLPFGDRLRAMPVSALWQTPAPL